MGVLQLLDDPDTAARTSASLAWLAPRSSAAACHAAVLQAALTARSDREAALQALNSALDADWDQPVLLRAIGLTLAESDGCELRLAPQWLRPKPSSQFFNQPFSHIP